MNEQIYILTEQNEVKESSSIYYGDDKSTPQLIKQVYRTDDDGNVVLAKCYHDYSTPSYEWDEYYNCTATATCKYDASHTVTETAVDTYTTNPYNSYEYNYFAYFNNPLFTTQQYYDDWQSSYEPDEPDPEPDEPDVPVHTHNWNWTYNSTHHWQYCTGCEETRYYEEHHIQEGEGTLSDPGSCVSYPEYRKYCTADCGYYEKEQGTEYGPHDFNKFSITTMHDLPDNPTEGIKKEYNCAYDKSHDRTIRFETHTPDETGDLVGNKYGHYKMCQHEECQNQGDAGVIFRENHTELETPIKIDNTYHGYICESGCVQEGDRDKKYIIRKETHNSVLSGLDWEPYSRTHENYKGFHFKSCTCGEYSLIQAHTQKSYEPVNNSIHLVKCGVCQAEWSENHSNIVLSDFNSDTHTATCGLCNHTWDAPHNLVYSIKDSREHYVKCECGLTMVGTHEFKTTDGSSVPFCKYCGYNEYNN